MKRAYKLISILAIVLICVGMGAYFINKSNFNPNAKYKLGQPIDSINGVIVYYNGMVGHTGGRNLAPDGYNIGMKYQCVEFVKRYYYQRFNHHMPDAYGNAKDFYDAMLADSTFNTTRGLVQYKNESKAKPLAEDLLIFDGHNSNPYGHVAIVAWATDTNVCIIQQNPGPFANSRDTFILDHVNDKWSIRRNRVLGWLRKPIDTAR